MGFVGESGAGKSMTGSAIIGLIEPPGYIDKGEIWLENDRIDQLPIGKARYGIMLREDGLVFDDGTTSRLDECHYFMTTTTSNAAAVLSHMEYYLQVQWPELDVKVTSVTEQWAAMALAGPNSRNVLSKLLPTINLSLIHI